MNRKKINFNVSCLFVALMMLLPACDWFKQPEKQQVSSAVITEITAPELLKLMESGKDVKIISVNSEDVYSDAHIPGDMRIAYDKLDTLDTETKGWAKNSPIVVYCTDYTCTASKAFVKELKKLGFSNVTAYSGGIAEWYQLGLKDKNYRVEGPAQEGFLKEPIKLGEQPAT
jgi:rhodanese-related sulfurtransferase